MIWQACAISSPEAESIKWRFYLSEMLFGSTSGHPVKAVLTGYTIVSTWRGLLPLAMLFGVLFSVLKPLARSLTWLAVVVLGGITAMYCFEVLKIIVPWGGPLIMLNLFYLCGTMIHIETEKIERNRTLALDLQLQAEREGKRIATNLHDESLPSLVRIMRLSDQLHTEYPDNPIPGEIRSRLESCITEMRRVINDLHPAALEEFGLVASMEHLINDFGQQSGIKTTYRYTGAQLSLPAFQELCVYRITQESLNNIEKHAGASEAEVLLEANDHTLRLQIADNGCGTTHKKCGTHGLQNITDRAKLLGARVEWKAPDKFSSGTMLVLTVPIDHADSPAPNGKKDERMRPALSSEAQ
jgi:signal transduction histidine kinase